jgi:hypothetical protein
VDEDDTLPPEFQVSIDDGPHQVLVRIIGDLDMATVGARDRHARRVGSGRHVVFDLGACVRRLLGAAVLPLPSTIARAARVLVALRQARRSVHKTVRVSALDAWFYSAWELGDEDA